MPKKKTTKSTEPLTLQTRLAKARLLGTLSEDTLQLLTIADKLGITQAKVEFNGSGDSGDIEQPMLLRPRKKGDPIVPWRDADKQDELVEVSQNRVDYVKAEDPEKWGMYTTPHGRFNAVSSANPEWNHAHTELLGMVKDIADEKVENCGVDWYNNEGGGGHVTFDFTTGKIELYVHAYERVVADEQTTCFDLLEDSGDSI